MVILTINFPKMPIFKEKKCLTYIFFQGVENIVVGNLNFMALQYEDHLYKIEPKGAAS